MQRKSCYDVQWRKPVNIIASYLLIFAKHVTLFQGTLWCVLQKYDVPNTVVDLVHCFHDGMVATMAISGEEAPRFEMRNGLPQGCNIIPTCILN